LVSDNQHIPHVINLYSYPSEKQFEQHLEFYLKYYNPISLYDILEKKRRGIPTPPKSFMLSFDDGFRECAEIIAPKLKKMGLPATFFLTTNYLGNKNLCYRHLESLLIEKCKEAKKSDKKYCQLQKIFGRADKDFSKIEHRLLSLNHTEKKLIDKLIDFFDFDIETYLKEARPYLSAEQVKSLINDGFFIGSHSIDHPLYKSIPETEQIQQTVWSMRNIRKQFNLDYDVFAFPFSDYGVGIQFFQNARKNIEIFFGTSGMMEDNASDIFQRIWMENTNANAKNIIADHYLIKMYRILTNRNKINRG
jgi:peptidoglycan/xylan/chitin deacetylase (PgdA/CDA1 family)